MSYQQCTRFGTILDFYCEDLWNWSSNRQAENGIMNYDVFTFDESNLVNFGPLTKKWPWLWSMTLKLNRVRAVVKIHVHAKYHQAHCNGSWVIYDLEIFGVLSGFQDTCSSNISSSCVQRFISYRANREKTRNEDNTVRRYRADSKNVVQVVLWYFT